MPLRLLLPLCAALLAACQSPPAADDTASILPQPVSRYECADGIKLDVRLTSDAALISVNGSDEIQLPRLAGGANKSVYTNGKQTVEVAGDTLSYGLGRAVPVTCKGG